jgi:hypothetical protein
VQTENIVASDRNLDDDAIVKILLFEDSGNDLLSSDSGLIESYMEYAQKKISKVKWFCQKCSVSFHPGMCGTKYHTAKNTDTPSLCLVKISFICLQ